MLRHLHQHGDAHERPTRPQPDRRRAHFLHAARVQPSHRHEHEYYRGHQKREIHPRPRAEYHEVKRHDVPVRRETLEVVVDQTFRISATKSVGACQQHSPREHPPELQSHDLLPYDVDR